MVRRLTWDSVTEGVLWRSPLSVVAPKKITKNISFIVLIVSIGFYCIIFSLPKYWTSRRRSRLPRRHQISQWSQSLVRTEERIHSTRIGPVTTENIRLHKKKSELSILNLKSINCVVQYFGNKSNYICKSANSHTPPTLIDYYILFYL